MKQFSKILIANRGEIALRVMKTCREMGIDTLSIYKQGEEDYPHALYSDEAVCLGEGTLGETYLNQDLLLKIAKDYNVDAVHPGYGLLSENTTFAKLMEDNGVTFIGPSPESIQLMGDKKTSKVTMEKAKIPVIPGYHGDNQEGDFLKKEAEKIGYPVLVKASAGGGGKGMRIVQESKEFDSALDSAKREAKNAFGDDRVLIEKFIENPRHIEVQVLSDTHGNHLHLFERECSIQRRYQKVVEESPSPSLTDKLRKEVCDIAVNVSRTINYKGAGTVELIYDDRDQKFYFLEMNTRLQVEHPITEMVTGVDIVNAQILVAQGEKLPFSQSDILQRGHAIEVRLYAEDPDNGFLPAIGTLEHMGTPSLNNVRLDSGLADGNKVTVEFDPMLAKLICWGRTREEARKRMLCSLNDVPCLGLKTNRKFLKKVLEHKEFIAGNTYTHFIETYKEDLINTQVSDEETALLIAGFLLAETGPQQETKTSANILSVWDRLSGLRVH